jgi:hypothetical protein
MEGVGERMAQEQLRQRLQMPALLLLLLLLLRPMDFGRAPAFDDCASRPYSFDLRNSYYAHVDCDEKREVDAPRIGHTCSTLPHFRVSEIHTCMDTAHSKNTKHRARRTVR